MPKLIVSDPKTGKSQALELETAKAFPLIGRKLGEIVDGSIVSLPKHKLQITGGSDKDGTPMRPGIHGGVRVAAILSGGVGFHPSNKGDRKRKMIRGDTVTDEIVQINLKIAEAAEKVEAEPKPDTENAREK